MRELTQVKQSVECTVLVLASTKPQPVVPDGKIAVRQMMKLTLSWDHRIADGAPGVIFVNAIKQQLEDSGASGKG